MCCSKTVHSVYFCDSPTCVIWSALIHSEWSDVNKCILLLYVFNHFYFQIIIFWFFVPCSKVSGRNVATLRKTEFFHLEIAGKVGPYHGCCLDRSFVCIKKNRSLMKSQWIWRCKSFPKSLQLAIFSEPLRVIWPRSAGNISCQHFFKPGLQLMFYWRDLWQLRAKMWNGQCHKMELQCWYCFII